MKKFAIALMVLSLGLFNIVGCGGDVETEDKTKTTDTEKGSKEKGSKEKGSDDKEKETENKDK